MKNLLWIMLAVSALMAVFYILTGTQGQDEYIKKIEQHRAGKDHNFKTSPDSPFAGDTTFTGLKYFAVDPSYRIIARLVPAPQKHTVTLGTSDGREKRYLAYGYAEFELHGRQNRLLILEIADAGPYRGTLFLAFGDETSARETYGGGRYMDIEKERGASIIVLDFNLAYNPYCAYNNNYSCPLPPPENLLPIPIRAGEMNYIK